MQASSNIPATYVTVGVTGHIDHGKTSLVGVLTGIETDTHPEEKQRGITIDLGFASYREEGHTFAFIDAPGHQKYVGNLLAGVSAVDIGLLVVACDQGIQEQTLEHASVLKTLGVPKLIVALSRIDLCDEHRQAEILEELEVFLADVGFEELPIVPLSSVTGAGIAELKHQLCAAADSTQQRAVWRAEASFRMPIDRVLNVPGRGLVVAGTVWSGSTSVGDMLEIVGEPEPLRVREIESHGEIVSTSRLGVRTAINLAGTVANEVKRGDELVSCNSLSPSSRLLATIELYSDALPLNCPATIQMHTATTACAARIIGVKQLHPGQKAVVIVEPEKPIIATLDQLFLIRRPYPVGTLGGGQVLARIDDLPRKNRDLIAFGNQITGADTAERLVAWIHAKGELFVEPIWFETQLGVPQHRVKGLVAAAAEQSDSIVIVDGVLVSQHLVQKTADSIRRLLDARAKDSDDAWLIRDSIAQRTADQASEGIVNRALDLLVRQEIVVELNGLFAIASEKTLLSKKQRAKMEQMLKLYEGSITPPMTKELATTLSTSLDAVNSLVRHATQQRLLVNIGQGLYYSTAVFTQLCDTLRSLFGNQAELSVAEIRDGWKVTRKYAIPLLEFCDRNQITIRQQDVRTQGPGLAKFTTQPGPSEIPTPHGPAGERN